MRNRKKLPLPILVMIIGIVIGLVVAGVGLFKQVDSKRINKERKEVAIKEARDAVDRANKRLKEIEEEYYPLKEKYEAKASECDSIVTGSDGWFAAQNKCTREKSDIQDRLWDLESEDSAIKNEDYTAYWQEVKPMSYQIFYIIGSSIAGVALLGAFIIYLVKGKKTYN